VGQPATQTEIDAWVKKWSAHIPERDAEWVAELERIVRLPEDD